MDSEKGLDETEKWLWLSLGKYFWLFANFGAHSAKA